MPKPFILGHEKPHLFRMRGSAIGMLSDGVSSKFFWVCVFKGFIYASLDPKIAYGACRLDYDRFLQGTAALDETLDSLERTSPNVTH